MTRVPTPEQVAQTRHAYLEGEPVQSICKRLPISLAMLYRCLDGEFPDGSGAPPATIPRRRAPASTRAPAGSRAALVAQMWRTAERQVKDIEHRLQAAGLEVSEGESNARTLAIVAKTLRELSAFDRADKSSNPQAAKNGDDPDSMPRNVDDLRRALARKLDAFVARTSNRVPGDAQ